MNQIWSYYNSKRLPGKKLRRLDRVTDTKLMRTTLKTAWIHTEIGSIKEVLALHATTGVCSKIPNNTVVITAAPPGPFPYHAFAARTGELNKQKRRLQIKFQKRRLFSSRSKVLGLVAAWRRQRGTAGVVPVSTTRMYRSQATSRCAKSRQAKSPGSSRTFACLWPKGLDSFFGASRNSTALCTSYTS